MTILTIASYVFAGLILLFFARIFWPIIVFVAVLAWTLLTGVVIPLIACILHLAAIGAKAGTRHARSRGSARKRVMAGAQA